jgi:hypothetical protein
MTELTMWGHRCEDGAGMAIGVGEACSWCGMKENGMNVIEDLKLEEPGSAGHTLRAYVDYEGFVAIENDEPWAGDSEVGFGRSAAIRLTREQVINLAAWLLAAAKEQAA